METNRRRSREEPEYELLDTGVFDDDRYFDVFVEYAKADAEDLLIRITVCNRGPEAATLHLLPTLWFRNTWSWADGGSKPVLARIDGHGHGMIHAHHTDALFQEFLDDYYLYCEGDVPLLFTENETNHERLFGTPNASPYVKDGFDSYLVHNRQDAVNPLQTGTKAAPHYQLSVGAGSSQTVRLRLSRTAPGAGGDTFADFDELFRSRIAEADEFYAALTPDAIKADTDRVNVMRQALAGMLWTKQYFYYDVDKWLEEHHVIAGAAPADAQRRVVPHAQ